MKGMEFFLELSKACLSEAVNLHNAAQIQRYVIWKGQPTKGKRAFEPELDTHAVVATYSDLIDAAIRKFKQVGKELDEDTQ